MGTPFVHLEGVRKSYRRDGERFDTFVRLTGVHAAEELLEKVQPRSRPIDPNRKPKPPEDQPGNPQPRPMPVPGRSGNAGTPPEIAKMIQTREGYANYYFNTLNRNRVWDAMLSHGDFRGLDGTWIFDGDLAGGGTVRIKWLQRGPAH